MKASPARIIVGLVLGILVGYLSAKSRVPLLARIPALVAPLGTLFINAIRVCVIPLVTSSLIVGCASSQNPGHVRKLAGRSLALILTYLALSAVFAGVVSFVVFERLHFFSHPGASAIKAVPLAAPVGLGSWVSDLIPSNLFKAAADGALLPLITFSVAFGFAISKLPFEHRELLVRWFQAIAAAFTQLIDTILQTAPIGVFCLAVGLPAATGIGGVGALFAYVIVLSLVSGAFVVLVLYPSVAAFAPVPFRLFVRSAAPAQALAFTSRSSLAALPATYQAAREGLALPEDTVSFFLPFAASIFRVGGCMAQMVGICFLASFYQVPLSWTQLAGIAVSAVAVSLTVPGIPGGAIIVMTPILASAGIPLEGMAMLLAVDTIPDMFRTMANVTGWISAGALLSSTAADGKHAPADAITPSAT